MSINHGFVFGFCRHDRRPVRTPFRHPWKARWPSLPPAALPKPGQGGALLPAKFAPDLLLEGLRLLYYEQRG